MQGIKNWWEEASPRTKRIVMGAGALSIFVAFATFVSLLDRNKPRARPEKTTSNTTVMMPSRKNTDMEGVAAQVTAVTRRLNQLDSDRKADRQGIEEQLKQVREMLGGKDAAPREMADVKAQLDVVEKKLNAMSASSSSPAAAATADQKPAPDARHREALDKLFPMNKRPAQSASASSTGEAPQEQSDQLDAKAAQPAGPARPQLRVIGADEGGDAKTKDGVKAAPVAGAETRAPQAEADFVYLPMGSLISGVLLNGLDAPTSGAAVKNPTPALVRVKKNAILPNHAQLDVKECFILVSGYASLSSERAYLRSEGMSCVREDGGVVEVTLDGYAIGEDGKVGMRGRPVTRQGAVIAKSFASGILSGVGKALQPSGVIGLNLNPSSIAQTQSLDVGTALESGMFSGASNTLGQISKFYLDMAKEMLPVVEIDAMRPVTIVLTHGARLKFNRS